MSWGMLRDDHLQRLGVPIATSLLVALLAAGCSSGNSLFGGPPVTASAPPPVAQPATPAAAPPPAAQAAAPPPPSPSLGSKISNLFSTSSANSPQGVAGAQQPALDCPLIDIRSGASTLQIPPPTEDGNSTMALKYQGTFVRAARECAAVNQQMMMKVGIEGRLIVGPAGGPGEVDVPLRIAVVSETTSGIKPIVTKFIRMPVTVAQGQESATFTYVEEGLSFPMPTAADLESYIVYIGFDPLSAEAQEKPKSKPKPKPKIKPTAPTG